MHNRRQTMLENRAMPLGRAATAFVDQWTHLASPDFQSPMEVLSARAAGVPVIYPSVVMDKSGALQRDVAPQVRAFLSVLSQGRRELGVRVHPPQRAGKVGCRATPAGCGCLQGPACAGGSFITGRGADGRQGSVPPGAPSFPPPTLSSL